jgi:protein TonB
MTDDEKTTPFLRDDKPVSLAQATAVSTTSSAAPLNMQVGGSFIRAKTGYKMPRWAMPLLAVMILGHAAGIGGSWAASVWEIDRLEPPKEGTGDIALAPPPPPPPPPPKGGEKPKVERIEPRKQTVKDILVQPTKVEKIEKKDAGEVGNPDGVEGGEVGGEVGGEIGGVVGAPPPPPPPPPPPAPPQNVAPTLLESQRIAGEKNIVPNDNTKTEIQRSGKDRIVGSYKLCITVDGGINTISQLKSTGFPAYDSKIQAEMRNWRYRPFLVNGKPQPVCTAVTFVYTQK